MQVHAPRVSGTLVRTRPCTHPRRVYPCSRRGSSLVCARVAGWLWVGVPALCGALNRGPFVVGRESKPRGLCRDAWPLWQHRTERGRAPPCGRRATARTIISRRSQSPARGQLVINGLLAAMPAHLLAHEPASKERINATVRLTPCAASRDCVPLPLVWGIKFVFFGGVCLF